VAISVKCTASGAVASFASQYDATQAGWRFATIVVKDRTKHFVFSPTEKVRWLDEALGETERKRGKRERDDAQG
jgi:hypothetical protein